MAAVGLIRDPEAARDIVQGAAPGMMRHQRRDSENPGEMSF